MVRSMLPMGDNAVVMERWVKVMDSDDEAEMRQLQVRRRKRPRNSFKTGSLSVCDLEPASKCSRSDVTTGDVNINDLNDDLLVTIFKHLKLFPDLMRVSRVCKRWREVGRDPRLWSSLSFENFEHVSDEAVQRIFSQGETMRSLKSLSLAKCHRVTEGTIKIITRSACVNSLEQIDLSWCSGASSTSVRELSRFPGLKEVRLAHCRSFLTYSAQFLALCSPQLQVLDLNCCKGIRTGMLSCIADHCPKLKHLNIANSRYITDYAVCYLVSKCCELEVLDLSWCTRINGKSLNAIAEKLPKLRKLGLSETQATNSGLLKVVRSCIHLEELLLARCSIGDLGAAIIARHCKNSLKTLNLASCEDLSDTAVRVLISKCKALTTLDVSRLPCRQINDFLEELPRQITVYY
eukprot:Plantae.Rhodophyta-Purpureofilum_apyrenoidigerum.ctg2489.p1 GENE.Plantae.Rhodophyta-Purpureofilum_apyrenoidigerum.ctg2489~~Plantae.Rhodophyta-Purpureofilum_apyrenoidigerum.ctg2489.p1  ORF type:complete len:406 (-),score=38.05 Plantae.Rhodophyta-Purpureofilum_apyrenoidigerum.ctg2489:688-1905(-)